MEKYITPNELRAIADACEALQPLWSLLTSGPQGGVSFEQGDNPARVLCYSSDGDEIGFISWCEDGAAFYLTGTED